MIPKINDFGDLILRHSPSGIGIFQASIAPDGIPDLLWVARSDSAIDDLGFDPLAEPTWFGVSFPAHRTRLLSEYLHVLQTGEPIHRREVCYEDPPLVEGGWFRQDVVRLSADLLLITWINISEMKSARADLKRKIETDLLTGLKNRFALNDLDPAQFAGLAMIDLDRFKPINDTLGHEVGDRLLREIADRLKSLIREDEMALRLGGDEFALVLCYPTNIHGLAGRMRALLDQLQKPCRIGERFISIGASIGVVESGHAASIDTLLRSADVAMYTAKSKQIGVQAWNYELLQSEIESAEILFELQQSRGSYGDEFELYYQPIVSLKDGSIIGLEALLRWQSQSLRRWVSPGQFIPLAEKSGEIYRLTNWVIDAAIAQAIVWGGKIPISINVSRWDLERPEFTRNLGQRLADSGLPPSAISLEVTERAISQNLNYYQQSLKELSALKISLKIDDFGTGDSGLQRLLEANWDTIKIDRSLAPSNGQDFNLIKLCRAAIDLSHNLGFETIVEGVETADQLALLQGLGADAAQGYYFARPMPASEINV